MNKILTHVSNIFQFFVMKSRNLFASYKKLSRTQQWATVAGTILVLGGGIYLLSGSATTAPTTDAPTVTLSSLGELSGNGSGGTVIGAVRSITEASILAQSGGTVKSVRATIGSSVAAGFVIATLENDSQAAQVLQAQGAYDSAVASRNIVRLQSGNAGNSFEEAKNTARITYRTSFTTIDTILATNVDSYFSRSENGQGLYTNGGAVQNADDRARAIKDSLKDWQNTIADIQNQDPAQLLSKATTITTTISTFLSEISEAANARYTSATPTQLANLSTARQTIDGVLTALSAARDSYNAKKTAAEVGGSKITSSDTALASADAVVKQALGALRGAQANYEKTVIRAPISGTLNFLPIRVGDYVANFAHVATVAQNGALEIVASVSEDDRQNITVGMHLKIEDKFDGVVTSVAPALDPVTKQIEVHIAVTDVSSTDLVNGQSVRITLPNALAPLTSTTATSTQNAGPLLLPLTTLKLTPTARIVFSVTDGRLVAHPVEIGEVRGDRIEILTVLPADLRIVTDARGLSEGQKVLVATSTP